MKYDDKIYLLVLYKKIWGLKIILVWIPHGIGVIATFASTIWRKSKAILIGLL